MRHTTFSLWCCFRQYPCDLGSVPAERVGQCEMGRFQHWAQVIWQLLGLAVETPWLALDGHFSSALHKWA